MSRFFIDRPIFAWVIALAIMLGGALAIHSLPVNQYPNIAAPAVQIGLSWFNYLSHLSARGVNSASVPMLGFDC